MNRDHRPPASDGFEIPSICLDANARNRRKTYHLSDCRPVVMTPTPNATNQSIAQDMLQSIVQSICHRPGDTAAQRDARSRDVVRSIEGFRPRDPVEIMLAGVAVAHVHLIHDSTCDALSGQTDVLKARTKSTIVALDRVLIGVLKELRTAQARPVENWADVEQPPATVVQAPEKPGMEGAAAQTEAVKPKVSPAPRAPLRAQTHTTAPRPPMPLLPGLQPTAASIATLMALLSPPTTPCVVRSSGVKPLVTSSTSPTQPPALQNRTASVKQELTTPPKAPAAMMTAAPKDPGSVESRAPVAATDGIQTPPAAAS